MSKHRILNEEGEKEAALALIAMSRLVWDAHGIALQQGNKLGLCDEVDNAGQSYQSAWAEKWLRYAISIVSAADNLPDIDG